MLYMRPFCETFVKEILPVLRSLLAKKLIETYGLSQKQVATKLETTQPAISQYKRGLRGSKNYLISEFPEVDELVNSIAKKVASGELAAEQVADEFCAICEKLEGRYKSLKN